MSFEIFSESDESDDSSVDYDELTKNLFNKLLKKIKSDYEKYISGIKSKKIKYKLMKHYYNKANVTNDTLFLDMIAEQNNCVKTSFTSVFSDNSESELFFYIDNVNAIYKTKTLYNLYSFLKDLNDDSKKHKFIQVISNDSKRRCIFKYDGKNLEKLKTLLQSKFETNVKSYDSYIISDIKVDNYNEYYKKCEKLFEYLAENNFEFSDMQMIKKKYDKKTKKYYNEFIYNINQNNLKELINSLPVTLNLTIDNSVAIKGDKNNVNYKSIVTEISNEEKAKKWIKDNCEDKLKIKDIISEFKKNNPNVKYNFNFIGELLKSLNYKKKHSRKGNEWIKYSQKNNCEPVNAGVNP